MRGIAVTALAEGWMVTIDHVSNDRLFRSGREAKRAVSVAVVHLRIITSGLGWLPRRSRAPPMSQVQL